MPWWFPRRAPDVAGTLIHVQTQHESFVSADVMGAIFKIFTDIVWSIAGESQHQHRSQEGGRGESMVTLLRIRTSDGTQRDARLRGHLTGANLTLGDKVSLWGWKRRGMLVVRRGFNHTSKSVISSSAMKSALPMLGLLLTLALGFYLWVYFGHVSLWPR
jgi:hypothetical protein